MKKKTSKRPSPLEKNATALRQRSYEIRTKAEILLVEATLLERGAQNLEELNSNGNRSEVLVDSHFKLVGETITE